MCSIRASTAFVIFVLTFAFYQNVYALNAYQSGEEISGQEYNDVLKIWIDRTLIIWVGIDDDDSKYIFFVGETGLGDATVRVQNSETLRVNLRNAIEKAIEWSDVAKKNGADASRSLGCFGEDRYSLCAKSGTAFDENQMGLQFYSTNGGKQINLIVSLVDRNNQFITSSIYLEIQEIKKLLSAVDQIENTLEKAKKSAADKNLFK